VSLHISDVPNAHERIEIDRNRVPIASDAFGSDRKRKKKRSPLQHNRVRELLDPEWDGEGFAW
jgi:hypothetical protein